MLVSNGILLFGRVLSVGVNLGTESVDAPTAIEVFLPALPWEGYLEARTTTVAEGLGIFKDIVTAD
jgi:hypothetical protein